MNGDNCRTDRPATSPGIVVAEIKKAAWLEILAGELGDQCLVGAADPSPDAMQADAIDLRQVSADQLLLDVAVVQQRIAINNVAARVLGREA